jgi:hypothetical protein
MRASLRETERKTYAADELNIESYVVNEKMKGGRNMAGCHDDGVWR